MTRLQATVNGSRTSLAEVTPHTTALNWLRNQGLTGAKEGCAEGECGACAVLVARPDEAGGTVWTSVNSCLVPAATLDGQEVVTSEGLADADGTLHPVQQEMAVRGGSQCGYCTPGFVCSMAAEFYRPGRCEGGPCATETGAATEDGTGGAPGSAHEVGPNGFDLHALSGNLCRCTGYRPIRDAAYAVGSPEEGDPLARRRDEAAPQPVATRIEREEGAFVRPADLAETLELLAQHPDAVLVAGATDYGVEVNIRGTRPPRVVAIDRVPELRTLEIGEDRIELGAALTLSEIEHRLAGRVPLLDALFPQFASRLIRNGATLGGNLGTGSPIGDSPPVLLALEADLVLASTEGTRAVPLVDYFTGYRETVRRPGELIAAVRFPLPLATTTAFHKIAKRRFDDISSVAVGYALEVTDGVVQKARIGLGGVAATPIRALETEQALEGQPWTRETVRHAASLLAGEGTPMEDHRASARYRAAMLGTSLRKLLAESTRAQEVGA